MHELIITISIGLASVTYFIDTCFWIYREICCSSEDDDKNNDSEDSEEEEIPDYAKRMFS